jgi:hypothetical protein
VNNLDLVNQDCFDADAKLTCSTSGFWTLVNGGIELRDAVKKDIVAISGSMEAVSYLHDQLLAATDGAHGVAVATGTSASSGASTAPMRRIHSGNRDNEDSGSRRPTVAAVSGSPGPVSGAPLGQVLKSGWLLKKRDVFNGWRCRYFVLYPGKLAYYTDQHDTQPKAVVSLVGAEVYAAKRCTISGNSDHWYLM